MLTPTTGPASSTLGCSLVRSLAPPRLWPFDSGANALRIERLAALIAIAGIFERDGWAARLGVRRRLPWRVVPNRCQSIGRQALGISVAGRGVGNDCVR